MSLRYACFPPEKSIRACRTQIVTEVGDAAKMVRYVAWIKPYGKGRVFYSSLGHVAQVFDPLSGRSVLDTLWGVAVTQGRAAGQNMAGQATPYRKAVPCNVTRLAGLTTTIIGAVGQGRDKDLIGIARGDSETWRQLPDALVAQNAFDVNRLRLLVAENRLMGAVVMGDQTLSLPLYRLVAGQADITPIREQLLRPAARLGDLIAGFWSDWRERHAAA